jgi:MOSC domain-containing protein YiiM
VLRFPPPFGSDEVENRETVSLGSADANGGGAAAGRLGGIARHGRPRGPMETLDHVAVNRIEGIHGDFRGAARPGKVPRRQISLMEAESWAAAMAELGRSGEGFVPWQERRANLLVEGLRLPRKPGTVIAIGASLRIELTCECDPCSRMEEIAPGLKAVLIPDWRGGVLGKVITDGEIAVGDEIRIEE